MPTALAEAPKIYSNSPDILSGEIAVNSRNRRIGGFAIEQLQARHDATTQFAELINGSMRTTFVLRFDGEELYGQDGRPMGEVTEKAIAAIEEEAKKDPKLKFEVSRRILEREEYLLALAMAKGEGPANMVITSEYPKELVGAKKDIIGYNVTRKQAMARALMRMPDGNILMTSQTLDGSNRRALEEIHTRFNHTTQEGTLLDQRITTDEYQITDMRQAHLTADKLMDEVMGTYDDKMSDQFGGKWHAGRQPLDYRNTYNFAKRQTDLVEAWVEHKLAGTLNEIKYNLVAAMRARFDKERSRYDVSNPKVDILNTTVTRVNFNSRGLYEELAHAGQSARVQGLIFSACGETISPDDQAGLGSEYALQFTQSGILKEGRGRRDRYGSRTFTCSKGHSNERPHNQLIPKCKICGIDVMCDPAKTSSTRNKKTIYSYKPKEFTDGLFDNSTTKAKVELNMISNQK